MGEGIDDGNTWGATTAPATQSNGFESLLEAEAAIAAAEAEAAAERAAEAAKAAHDGAMGLIETHPSVTTWKIGSEKGEKVNPNYRYKTLDIVTADEETVRIQFGREGLMPDQPDALTYIDQNDTHWLLNHEPKMGPAEMFNIPDVELAEQLAEFFATVDMPAAA